MKGITNLNNFNMVQRI